MLQPKWQRWDLSFAFVSCLLCSQFVNGAIMIFSISVVAQFKPSIRHTLVVWACILFPLMESIQSLLKFIERRDIFICGFIVTVKTKVNCIVCILTLHMPSKVMNFGPSVGYYVVTMSRSTWSGSLIIIHSALNICSEWWRNMGPLGGSLLRFKINATCDINIICPCCTTCES